MFPFIMLAIAGTCIFISLFIGEVIPKYVTVVLYLTLVVVAIVEHVESKRLEVARAALEACQAQ